MMLASKYIFLGLFASLSIVASGSAFLKATHKHEVTRVSEQDVQTSLLSEIEGSLGTGIGSKRVTDMKASLSPMFPALPKNVHGNLEHITVRYVLHRVFIQRHGWSIKGLDPGGAGWNSSTATGILKDQVPAFIQDLFEQRLGGRGLGLNELAVFAATIEHLVHNEAVGRLGHALNIHNLLPTALMTNSQADEVLDTYMMAFIIGVDLSSVKLEEVKKLVGHMSEIFLAWPDTQKFVREVQQNITNNAQTADQISFATLVKIAETIGERFGRFQDAECKGLKATLLKNEDRGSGRVRLSDFYRPALDGAWQFQESIAYLRQLGTLDESNSDEPRVMVPNYLTSQANCIASSDYYSVCCIDECEDIFVHLEKELAAPEATSTRLLELISSLPSSSVTAPRTLSATLRTRLEDIAAHHGGTVQLHGRLFAQWMHHAYPRECPYPHLSGTTSQENAMGWSDRNGGDSLATKEELSQFTSVSNSTSTQLEAHEDVHDLMMWSHEEELLVVRPTLGPVASMSFSGGMAGVRGFMLFVALSSVVFGLVRTVITPAGVNEGPQKFMV